MSRKLKNWLHAYMEYSAYSEAPDKYHFWTGVSVIAGALRRRVWIDQQYFQWTPNFYIVFVAPPGIVSKSTTASIGMNLLKEIPDVKFGPEAVTWQSLVQSLAQSTEMVEIGEEMYPMSCITISSSEFGTFLNPSDREMVDVLVSLWDGQVGVWEKATKTQGSDRIENPWINIIACTTPSWIAGNFPEYMIGGGFTSRTVFVYAEQKRRLVAYPGDHIPKDFNNQRQELIHDLEHIATNLKGQYRLSDSATKWGEQWYQEHYDTGIPDHLTGERFGGYLARKQTHIHKLAMVIAAAASDELTLTEHHLEEAAIITTNNEHDMPKIFANIGKTDMTRAISEVINFVTSHQKIPLNKLYNHFHDRLTWQEFEVVLQSAIRSGNIETRQMGTELFAIAVHKVVQRVETNEAK